ncbi:hypothetical protein GCM10009558_106060 [Virgisporangium aurantiacum]
MSAECFCAADANRLSLVSAPQPALDRSELTSRSTSAVGPVASVLPFVPPPVWVGFFVGLVAAFDVGAVEDAAGGVDEAEPESAGNAPGTSSPPGAAAGGGSSPAAAGLPA